MLMSLLFEMPCHQKPWYLLRCQKVLAYDSDFKQGYMSDLPYYWILK